MTANHFFTETETSLEESCAKVIEEAQKQKQKLLNYLQDIKDDFYELDRPYIDEYEPTVPIKEGDVCLGTIEDLNIKGLIVLGARYRQLAEAYQEKLEIEINQKMAETLKNQILSSFDFEEITKPFYKTMETGTTKIVDCQYKARLTLDIYKEAINTLFGCTNFIVAEKWTVVEQPHEENELNTVLAIIKLAVANGSDFNTIVL